MYKIFRSIIFISISMFFWLSQVALANKSDDFTRLSTALTNTTDKTIRIIIEVSQELGQAGVLENTANIKSMQNSVLNNLKSGNYSDLKIFENFPMMSMTIDKDTLSKLFKDKNVLRIYQDGWAKPSQLDQIGSPLLYDSTLATQADKVWATGKTGAGQVVAVLDTGVRASHEMFSGKIAAEACFSTNDPSAGARSSCPNRNSSQIGNGAARPDYGATGYHHGTHVAGIAVGNRITGSPQGDGVARGARLIAVNVFTYINNTSICGVSNPCLLSSFSDVIRGLDYVYGLRNSFSIAAVNLSLGGGRFSSHCDSASSMTTAVNRLNNRGIAVIAASGNEGFINSVSEPACISRVVSVGSTLFNGLTISDFSNSANILDLLAPGGAIDSADASSNVGYVLESGTSMASPHVAGAFALLKSVNPKATRAEIEAALKSTGRNIRDSRNGVSKPFIRLFAASNALPSQGNIIPILNLLLLD